MGRIGEWSGKYGWQWGGRYGWDTGVYGIFYEMRGRSVKKWRGTTSFTNCEDHPIFLITTPSLKQILNINIEQYEL